MLDHLTAEHDSIERKFLKTLGPSQLFTVAGQKTITSVGKNTPYGMLLHRLGDGSLFYSNPAFDELLGFPKGKGPSLYPKLLIKLMENSECLGNIDRYNAFFKTFSNKDLETVMNLQCADGDFRYFIFQSRALQGFRESPTGILTLVTSLTGAKLPHATPDAARKAAKAEKLHAVFLQLSGNAQLTMYLLTVSSTPEDVKKITGKSLASVNNYIREIKDAYRVEKLHEIVLLYKQFEHLCPA